MNIKQIELIAMIAAVEKIAEMGKLPPEAIFAAYMMGEPKLTEMIDRLVGQAVEMAALTEQLARHKGQELEETLKSYIDTAPDVKTAVDRMRADCAATYN